MRGRAQIRPFLALLVCLGACETASSAVAPAGPQAGKIADFFWVTLAILGTVWVLVIVFLLYAAQRRRLPPGEDPGQAPDVDARLTRWVGAATIVTALIVIGFLVADVAVGRSLQRLAGKPNAVYVTVIGHQWWWEVRYTASDPTKEVVTANELHIPVGRPVSIAGKSIDVIHSFWVPQLHGKRDLIPGYTTNLWLQADRPGIYRGQCAEFCGLQHAHMALLVVAQPEAEYEAWLEQQRDTALAPTSPVAQRGQQVFLATSCALCHSIRGTSAASNNGPDLTHVASRLTLGAGTLPNNVGALSGWILDPHAAKPGNNMPGNALATEDLHALVTYLGGLR
ncbi:MAG TPA: cytochrome c oxidase subunit II [Longimicrobiales bacterium]